MVKRPTGIIPIDMGSIDDMVKNINKPSIRFEDVAGRIQKGKQTREIESDKKKVEDALQRDRVKRKIEEARLIEKQKNLRAEIEFERKKKDLELLKKRQKASTFRAQFGGLQKVAAPLTRRANIVSSGLVGALDRLGPLRVLNVSQSEDHIGRSENQLRIKKERLKQGFKNHRTSVVEGLKRLGL